MNVSFANQKANSWVSIAGTATEAYDRAKAEELWNPFVKVWFPDGLDTAGLTLIQVRAESAEYWDAPNSKVLHLIGYAKAAVTGKPPEAGENREVSYPADLPRSWPSSRHDRGMADKPITNAEARARVTELVKDARICMLTTMTADGKHVSRPMGVQESEFDGDLWFFALRRLRPGRAGAGAPPGQRVVQRQQAARLGVDRRRAPRRATTGPRPRSCGIRCSRPGSRTGSRRPNLTLVKVHADTAEYWESAHSSEVVTPARDTPRRR